MRTNNDYSNDYNEFGQTATFVGIKENPSGSDQVIPIVYGYRNIEGIRFWNQVSTLNQSELFCAYALSEGWCAGIGQIYIDDVSLGLSTSDLQHRVPKLISTGKFAGVLEIEFIDGRINYGSVTLPNIGPSSILSRVAATKAITDSSSNWTGFSYLVCRFVYALSSPYIKLPKVSCDLFGRKIPSWVYGSEVSTYTDNPAYIVWDLMNNTRYGKSISSTSIDVDSFIAVAAACEIKRSGQLSGGQNIFRCNWICDPGNPILNNINLVLETFQINLSYIQDKWFLSIESSPQSSAYGTFPYVTFDDTNVIGSVDVQYPSLSEKFNTVSVEYIEPTQNYELVTASYSEGISDDNDIILSTKITSNLITSKIVAYDIAKMTLLRSRNQILYKFTANREAHQCRIGEYAYLNTTIPSTNNQKIIITSMTMNQDYTFDIECISYDSAWYPASFTDNVTIPYGTFPPAPTTPAITWSLLSDKDQLGYVIESGTITYTMYTTGVADGTAFTWRISGPIQPGQLDPDVTANDFVSGGLNGSGTITSGTATIVKVTQINTDIPADLNEPIIMTIRDNNGIPVAQNQLIIKNSTYLAAPTFSSYYTFTAPTLTDNTGWYLGYTDSTGKVFDTKKTAQAYSSGAVQNGFRAQISRYTTTLVMLDLQIGLIDRDINGQKAVKDIGVTWSSGSYPFGYKYVGLAPNNYGVEQWQWDYENPPLPTTPTLAKLLGGGTRWNPNTTITQVSNVLKMKAITGKTGQYELTDGIKIPIVWPGNGTANVNGYWYGPEINTGNTSSGMTIIVKFYDLTNKKYIGNKTFQLILANSYCLNDATVAASSNAWLSTMPNKPY